MSVPSGVALLAMLEGQAQRENKLERKYAHGIDLSEHDCALDCGNKIGNHQDDVGGFFVATKHGYCAICKACWNARPYRPGER